jgi:Tol biopolymer transport system component
MDVERWHRIEQVYHDALGRPAKERAVFVRQACADDPELCREVESLLARDGSSGGPIDRQAWDGASGLLDGLSRSQLSPGMHLGPYRIIGKLGAGGMGQVYRAHDARLGRSVAIKTSNARFGERFEREARAIAALNHPNICTLHDVGPDYLVMELVEGETLADRLRKGPLSAGRAVRIATEIAAALGAAHRKGIAHRDLKPANVMLTKSSVKLLDFGLAKIAPAAATAGGVSASVSASFTAGHTILGTPQYMAPEQIDGREVDTRADIFAFGCVFYEMLTGKRAFEGTSANSVMAAILERDPPALPPAFTRFDWLIRRCLEKDSEARFQSIYDVRLELERAPEHAATPRWERGLKAAPWIAAGLCLAALGGAWWKLRAPAATPTHGLTQITFDSGVTSQPDISPDGKLLVYASDRDGQKNLDLYVQQLPNGSPLRITQTAEDETEPAFSPDGTSIAFASSKAGGGIYLMPALGGEPRLLVRGGHSPKFSPDGAWISYWSGAVTSGDWLMEGGGQAFVIPTAGGTAARIHPEFPVARYPLWSPDGKRLIFEGVAPGAGPPEGRFDYWITPVEGGNAEATGIAGRLSGANLSFYVPDCWTGAGLFFSASQGSTRSIFRVALDGSGKAVADPVQLTNHTTRDLEPAISRDGHMVFATGTESVNVWGLPLDGASGKARGAPYRVTEGLAPAYRPSLSPDGRRLLFASGRNGPLQIWQRDLASGKETLAVSGPGPVRQGFQRSSERIFYHAFGPEWDATYVLDPATGESRKITSGGPLWDVDRKEEMGVMTMEAGGLVGVDSVELKSGRRVPLLRAAHWNLYQAYFSPDDRWLVFLANTGPNAGQIFVVRPQGMKEIPQADWLPITDGKTKVDKPRFSPDGKLIYFTLDGDGSRSVQAVRFDQENGRPIGDPFLVYDFRDPRLSMLPVGLGPLEISVGRDKVVTLLAESNFNIWMTELGTAH